MVIKTKTKLVISCPPALPKAQYVRVVFPFFKYEFTDDIRKATSFYRFSPFRFVHLLLAQDTTLFKLKFRNMVGGW